MRSATEREQCSTFSASTLSLWLLFLVLAFFLPYTASAEDSSVSQGGQYVLFEDLYEAECLKYSELTPFEGVGDTNALKLTPDKWHRPEPLPVLRWRQPSRFYTLRRDPV